MVDERIRTYYLPWLDNVIQTLICMLIKCICLVTKAANHTLCILMSILIGTTFILRLMLRVDLDVNWYVCTPICKSNDTLFGWQISTIYFVNILKKNERGFTI